MTHPRTVVSLLLVLLVSLSAAHATTTPQEQQKEYALSNYDVTIHLRNDGAIDIRETIRLDVRAGSFSSMYREVPMSRIDSLTGVTVTSSDVALNEVTVSRDDGDTVIRWQFPKQSAPASFEVRYRAHGALRTDGPENVLHWTAVGTGWDVQVSDVDVTLDLPAALAVPRDSLSLVPEPASLRATGGGWTAAFAYEALEAGEGFSVKASFPARIDAREVVDGLDVLKGLGWGLLVFIAFLVAYLRRSSRTSVDDVPVPDDPPLDLPEAARMLSDMRSPRMHGAMLFDLARRGHLTLRAETTSEWLTSTTTMHLDVHPDRFDLTPFEEAFLNELADLDTLSDLSTISSFRSDQRTEVRKRLQERGLLHDRTSSHNRYMTVGLGSVTIGVVASVWALVQSVPEALYPVATLLGVAAGSSLFVGSQYAPTEQGRRRRAEIEALIDEKKTQMETLRDNDPETAAQRLPEELPWLMLSPSISSSWFQKMETVVDDAGYGDLLPEWIHPCAEAKPSTAGMHLYLVALMQSGESGVGGTAGGGGVSGGIAGAGAGGAGGGGGGAA